MKTVLVYLKSVIVDPVFVRVCMAVWGVPFVLLGIFAAPQIHPSDAGGWFAFSLLALLGCYGAYLVCVALFGGARLVERSTGFMSEGGEILGLLFALVVAVVAVPITLAIREMRGKSEE